MTSEKDYYVQTESSKLKALRSEKYNALAEDLIISVPLQIDANILDFGCATGGLVYALKIKGFQYLKGTDISYWAIRFGHEMFGLTEEIEYCNINILTHDFDVILILDVLEYIPSADEIHRILSLIREGIKVVVRLPISEIEGDPYYLEVSRNDVNRIQCHTADWWHSLFEEMNFKLDKILSGQAIYESEGILARVYTKCK